MNTFQVELDRRAEGDLQRLPPHVQARLWRAFEALAVDPFTSRSGCDIRRVKGEPGRRAVRVGNYRAAYDVSGTVVRVLAVAHRSVAYR